MGPTGHAVVSSAVGGGVWVATGSIAAAAVAVGVGILMDVDHLYDYYQRFGKGKHDKIYVLFHGWEYSLVGLGVLAFFFHPPVFIAVVLAHLAHVATDHWHNGMARLGYSITFRVIKRFDAVSIAPTWNSASDKHKPLGRFSAQRLIESWAQSVFERWFRDKAKEITEDEPTAHRVDL